jgi:hypothetical protein
MHDAFGNIVVCNADPMTYILRMASWSNCRRSLYTVVLLSALSCIASGQLIWEKTVLDLNCFSTDPQIEVEFKFTNLVGSVSITKVAVLSVCGCTTIKSGKTEYGPGESGVIKGIFNPRGQRGPQKELIQVTSSNGTFQNLELNVLIRDPVRLTTNFLMWRVGDAPEPKNVAIRLAEGVDMKIKQITSNNPRVTAELKERKPT